MRKIPRFKENNKDLSEIVDHALVMFNALVMFIFISLKKNFLRPLVIYAKINPLLKKYIYY